MIVCLFCVALIMILVLFMPCNVGIAIHLADLSHGDNDFTGACGERGWPVARYVNMLFRHAINWKGRTCL